MPYATHIYARTVDHYAGLAAGLTLAHGPIRRRPSSRTWPRSSPLTWPLCRASMKRCSTQSVRSDPAETSKCLRRVFGKRIDWMSSGGMPLAANPHHRRGVSRSRTGN